MSINSSKALLKNKLLLTLAEAPDMLTEEDVLDLLSTLLITAALVAGHSQEEITEAFSEDVAEKFPLLQKARTSTDNNNMN